jgi:hypothetical protein
MWCDVDTDKFSALQSNDHEDIELDEANGRGNEQIHGGDVGAWLRRKVRHPWHDGPQRRLSDLEAELEQLALERAARP